MASAAVRFTALLLVLVLVHYLLLLPFCMGALCLFRVCNVVFFLSSLTNHLAEEERAGCIYLLFYFIFVVCLDGIKFRK